MTPALVPAGSSELGVSRRVLCGQRSDTVALMLKIRPHQKAIFVQVAIDRFVGDMMARLRQSVPERVAALGDEQARALIRYGIGRARSYGIESEKGAGVFVHMLFVFGAAFDTHPRLPWAARWLTSGAREAPKVRGLVGAAAQHLAELGARQGQGQVE